MSDDTYYYGQGKIFLATRDSGGTLGKYRWIGDVSALSLKLAVEKVEHTESYSGQRALARSFPISKSATLDMTLSQIDVDNLALTLYGSKQSAIAGTVTAEVIATMAQGDEIYLAHPGVSDVVITDSTGTPAVLTADTDYSVSADPGRISVIGDMSGFTAPYKVAYSYKATNSVGMFTAGQPSCSLKFEGVNLAEGNAAQLVTLYKVAPDPLQELALITSGNDVAGMQVTAGLLIDTSKAASSALGQFGDITQLVAA